MQVRTPYSSPALEEGGGAKALPKGVPAAKKAAPVPPKSCVAQVARPSMAPIAVPKVGAPGLAGPPSPRPLPNKRLTAQENTAQKVARLTAPSPVPPKAPAGLDKPVARQLTGEFDAASDGKIPPHPESGLVFADTLPDTPNPPLVPFTPTPSVVTDAPGPHDQDSYIIS